MPRRRLQPETPPVPPQVHRINPTAIYFPDQVRALLRLKASTLRREVKAGRLRIAKRAGRYYLLGAWLLQWIEDGELRRQAG